MFNLKKFSLTLILIVILSPQALKAAYATLRFEGMRGNEAYYSVTLQLTPADITFLRAQGYNAVPWVVSLIQNSQPDNSLYFAHHLLIAPALTYVLKCLAGCKLEDIAVQIINEIDTKSAPGEKVVLIVKILIIIRDITKLTKLLGHVGCEIICALVETFLQGIQSYPIRTFPTIPNSPMMF